MKKLMAIAMAAMMITMAGCSGQNVPVSEIASSAPAGRILLSVNPEIEIEYDDGGIVLEVEGRNGDGRELLIGREDYTGKDCKTVAGELVKLMYEAGYFDDTIGGNARNIVVKAEGERPDDGFLEGVAESVRAAVSEYKIGSETMTVAKNDMDGNGLIGLEKAKEIVLTQLGLSEADFVDKDYELDDGIYELEFTANGIEYEYDVHGYTGKVIKAEQERDDDRYDDWDDRYDYDWDDIYDDGWDD